MVMEHGGCSVGGSEAVDLLVMTLQFCTFCLQVRAKVHMPHSQVLRPPPPFQLFRAAATETQDFCWASVRACALVWVPASFLFHLLVVLEVLSPLHILTTASHHCSKGPCLPLTPQNNFFPFHYFSAWTPETQK